MIVVKHQTHPRAVEPATGTALAVPAVVHDVIHAQTFLGDRAMCGATPTVDAPISMTDLWDKSTCPACLKRRTFTFHFTPTPR